MNCKQIQTLIQNTIADDIKPDAQAELEEHLTKCSGCAQEYRVLIEVLENARPRVAPEVSESEWQNFHRNLRHAVAQKPARVPSLWKKRLVPAIALGLIALVIALFALQNHDQPVPSPVASEIPEETVDTADIQELLVTELGLESLYASSNEAAFDEVMEEINWTL